MRLSSLLCCTSNIKNVTSSDHDSFPTKVSSKTAPAKTPASLRDSQPINDSSVTDLTKMSSRTQHPPVPKSYERYNAARAVALFQKYADPDEPNVIGPEGFSQLCDEAHIPMDGALPLVLAWQLQAKEMGKFTRDEWISAMSALQISSLPQLTVAVMDLDNLLIKGGQAVKRPSPAPSTVKKRGSSDEPYERSTYWTYVTDRKKAFSKLYAFCFAYAKPPTARNIDMETATAFWSVLLSPQYPIMAEVIEFINEKGTYKGVNKDLWGMMLEFCQTVNPNLEDYEADGAWPTLLDDFVLMKSSKSGNDQTSAMVIE